ncbi:helix-turn-helix domain-containing protein [Streptomyces chrestomyceticus]|uniref:Helix-turn-helix domain-containing protein n=1 Tax=Streptomyces chrestomyceticus TaxID=68185 RepID=A0ABU7WNU4_9ACTN
MTIKVNKAVAKAMTRRYLATPSLSVAALCREFGYTRTVTIRVLEAHGVQIRKHTELKKPLVPQALKLAKAGWTDDEIASQLGVCRATVSNWKRAAGVSGKIGRRGCPEEIRERAIRLVIEQGWSASRAAKEVGYSEISVRRWIRSAGLGTGKPGPKRSTVLFQKAIDLATSTNWPPRKIAEHIGATEPTIRRWLREAGVELSATHPKARAPDKVVARAVELYDKHGLSVREVAVRIGRPSSTVWTWINAAGVIRQPVSKRQHSQ